SGSISGNGGSDMLIGPDLPNVWTVTGPDAGSLSYTDPTLGNVTGVGSFTGIGSLVGGSNADRFQLAGGTLSGSVTGGGGVNTLAAGNVANTWTVTNPDAGTVTGVAGGFVTIGNLTGGT